MLWAFLFKSQIAMHEKNKHINMRMPMYTCVNSGSTSIVLKMSRRSMGSVLRNSTIASIFTAYCKKQKYCIHRRYRGMACTGMNVPDIMSCGTKTNGPMAPLSRGNRTIVPINSEKETLHALRRHTVSHISTKSPWNRMRRCETRSARSAWAAPNGTSKSILEMKYATVPYMFAENSRRNTGLSNGKLRIVGWQALNMATKPTCTTAL
mmetsp:Transcript_1659/g.4109  ORF Transcript_1659/g.4109 Transcript_1659/m.4109 type:complete len:208 (-) Transcript_1659:947-1570(-)